MLSKPEDRWDEAMRLRDQLKFEFFFPDKASYRAGARRRAQAAAPQLGNGGRRARRAGAGAVLVASRVLRSFLDAQPRRGRAARRAPPGQPVEEPGFLDECGGVGRQMLLQGRLHGPAAVAGSCLRTR